MGGRVQDRGDICALILAPVHAGQRDKTDNSA